MELLVTYDVATADAAGERRLRKVAKICEAHGQRVQKSVFECTLNEAELEVFMHKVEKLMDLDADSLRIYRLPQPREKYVQVIGQTLDFDLHDPLVV